MDRCRKTAQPKRESTEKALGEGRRVQDRLTARFGLITSDDNVDIKWIDFYSATSPAGALCRDECRARAQEGIEDNLAADGHVEERVHQHRRRFDRRMIFRALARIGAE